MEKVQEIYEFSYILAPLCSLKVFRPPSYLVNRPSLGLLDLSIDHISIFNNGLKSIVKEQSISSLEFYEIFVLSRVLFN